jgi:phage terminase large subunit-like protein
MASLKKAKKPKSVDRDPAIHPYCSVGHNYALDVVSGKQVACIYVIGACKRYLKDIKNTAADFYMDWDEAEKYLRSVQKFPHVNGHWPTPNIVYDPWQCWVWMNIMGFKSKQTGFRRFRIGHLEISRGCGKSAMASQAALYFLALDNPNGNQISTVATKKDQARIVLDAARAMARKSTSYLKFTGVNVLAHTIVHEKSNSIIRALSSEHSGLDGLNDVLAICDELHAMKRDTFDVIYSGMSKRKDSLTLCITTAGQDIHSVGFSQSAYAKKVALGEVIDDQFFSAVYTLDKNDDWADESVWVKANPGLDRSVDRVTLRAKIDKALVSPSDIANIRIKHMNEWIAEADAFFDQKAWDACYDPKLKIGDFKGKQCRLGLDLASHIDITSIGIVFREKGIYYLFDRSYLPEDTVKSARNTLYDDCIGKGFLIKTPGAAINYEHIQKDAEELAKEYRVIECLYDPWNATETAQRLSNKMEMVKFAMNVGNFSEPMKKLDAAIREGKVRHNGSPLLRWCLGNVVAKEDHNGNVFPRKSHEKLKIDPIVAFLMAIGGWIQDSDEDSVYESSGIRMI